MMRYRRALAITLPAVILGAATCGAPGPRPIETLDAAPLHTFTEAELDLYLRQLPPADHDLPARVVALARKSIGQSYQLFCLGEFPFELHDPDPLYRLSASDCVTFVEQTYAMALSRDWPTFVQTLRKIRYRDGIIGIRTRNHFTESDWNANNRWLFEDVTRSIAGDAAVPYRLSIDRAALLRNFGIMHDGAVEFFDDLYVPRADLPALMPLLRDGDVVELVRGSRESPYVGHMGIIAHAPVGAVTLIHSGRPAVRELRLEDYLSRHPAFIGVKVLRPLDR